MSNAPPSRFTPSNKTTHERLTTNTVGLVALSDFRKRRAEVLEQQEREAREAALSVTNAGSAPDRSQSATPNNASDNSEAERLIRKKTKKPRRKALLSFGDDEEVEDDDYSHISAGKVPKRNTRESGSDVESETDGHTKAGSRAINSSVAVVPRAVTKAAMRREAAEREALRKEFLVLQAAVKTSEIAIPFVFYDGTNIPGGIVRVKKGDFIWVFLDKSRKVGADLGVGGDKNANVRREWARVGVDDLMLVRGTIIIPHVSSLFAFVILVCGKQPANLNQHYEFYFFIMNKTLGPGKRRLFDYSAEAPPAKDITTHSGGNPENPLWNPSKGGRSQETGPVAALEGASDDPTFTKVVDRRWYERNKHIYPASVWQEFDPEKDYQNEIRRDTGGNAFFFAR